MKCLLVFMCMIFCHIVDDYYLQGWLASAKQKKYWKDNSPDKLYRNDYKCALLMHGLSWSFMVHIPIIFVMQDKIIQISIVLFCSWILNAFVHAYVDNLKANKHIINLWTDQILHIFQIFFIIVFFFCCF